MIALVDTNVVLDVLLARAPHLPASAGVLGAIETGRCQGLLGATTITTVFYIARRHLGAEEALNRLACLMSLFGIAAVNQTVLKSALSRGFPDFEDSVLHEAACQTGAHCIVTRNVTDFRLAELPVYTPAQFLAALATQEASAQPDHS